MAIFTQENAPTWQALFNDVAKDKPAVGRVVRVTRGKHAEKVGVVTRHQESRYVNAFRYGNEASRAMTQVRGRYGFVVLIKAGIEDKAFWVNADLTMVCYDEVPVTKG